MQLLCCKGQSLRYLPGRATHVSALWGYMWGRGLRGNNATFLALCLSVTSSATHKQVGPFWCWFLGGWVCVHSRTLWVSPTNFPVRLGVSPAATTPTGFYCQRFWGFISLHQNPGLCGLSCSLVVLASYLHANWDHLVSHCFAHSGLPAATLPHVLSSLASCLGPSYQSGWMFLLLLLGCRTSIQFNCMEVLVCFCI